MGNGHAPVTDWCASVCERVLARIPFQHPCDRLRGRARSLPCSSAGWLAWVIQAGLLPPGFWLGSAMGILSSQGEAEQDLGFCVSCFLLGGAGSPHSDHVSSPRAPAMGLLLVPVSAPPAPRHSLGPQGEFSCVQQDYNKIPEAASLHKDDALLGAQFGGVGTLLSSEEGLRSHVPSGRKACERKRSRRKWSHWAPQAVPTQSQRGSVPDSPRPPTRRHLLKVHHPRPHHAQDGHVPLAHEPLRDTGAMSSR